MIERLTRPSATLHGFLTSLTGKQIAGIINGHYRSLRITLYEVGPVTSSKQGYKFTYPVYNPSDLSTGVMTQLYLVGAQTYSLKS